ncbi:hypothetical protein LG3211_4612 [Lysobacter gummosus]|nr:hypothetical protein LG3211_4612 [Lysobacter gummosus]
MRGPGRSPGAEQAQATTAMRATGIPPRRAFRCRGAALSRGA